MSRQSAGISFIDEETNSTINIDTEHYHIHEGKNFFISNYFTVAADGTLLTANNNDRESSNTSSVSIRQNPTGIVTTSAIQLRRGYAGTGGNASSRTAGSLTRANEVILKPSTKYLLRITNLSTGNNDINIGLSWYEVE